MPQVFKIAGYTVYFWVNENDPLEENRIRSILPKGFLLPMLLKYGSQKMANAFCAITIPKFQISSSGFLCRLLKPAVSQCSTYGIQHSNRLAFTVKK